MHITEEKKHTSSSAYTNLALSVYDLGIIKFSSRFMWLCPKENLLKLYNENISSKHLEVGVGSGYFLDKCKFPVDPPEIHLFDLNPNSIRFTSSRIKRYAPKTYCADILKPITEPLPTFDSISLNNVIHCLPGNMLSKEQAFKNLLPFLNRNGVLFGCTVLGKNAESHFLTRKLLDYWNKQGVFTNTEDNLKDLDKILANNFNSYTLKKVGQMAIFAGRV
jgi:hypothetical protein